MRTFTLLLLCGVIGSALAAHGDVLVSSSFHFGQDGWTLFGPGDLTIGDRSGMLFGSDKGKTVWCCPAPPTPFFLHNPLSVSFSNFVPQVLLRPQLLPRRQVLRLQRSPVLPPRPQRVPPPPPPPPPRTYPCTHPLTTAPHRYMSNGKDMIQDWDVILESKVWDLRVGQRNIAPAWVGASNHELSLNERSGWVNMRSGHAPTTTEMLRLFTSLSGLFIRGGFYDGHEESWLDNVVLKEGDHKADALLRQVEKHARHPSERVAEPEPQAAEEPSTPKYTGVLRSKAAIAAHVAREAAFQAAKQAHEEEQARIAEEERQQRAQQEAEAAQRLAEQQEAGAVEVQRGFGVWGLGFGVWGFS